MVAAGKFMDVKGINTHYHEDGQGEAVLLIHGSGPGVSAWANWSRVFPILSKQFHLYAPDVLGFGYTERPDNIEYGIDLWSNQMIDFIETIGEKQVSIIGNSFGGAIALHVANKRPDLVKKLVLMGSVGINHQMTDALDMIWGFEPSIENMKKLVEVMAYDQSMATNDELIEMRYKASIQDGLHEVFSSIFPAPRQRHVDAMALSVEELASIMIPTLLIHGRDDRIIPVAETSIRIAQHIPNAELHIFPNCGHWVQIEKFNEFTEQVMLFLNRE